MKNRYYLLFCLIVSSSLYALAQGDIQHRKDSLREVIGKSEGPEKLSSYNRLSFIYMSEIGDDLKMDTLLMLFNEMDAEARRQGDVNLQGRIRGNTLISYKNKGMFDEVIARAPECLKFLAENELWKFYYQIYVLVIDSYRSKGNYDKAISEAEKVYELAKDQNDAGGMAIALYSIANTYNNQKRWKDQEQYLRECIDLLRDNDAYLNILTQSYAFLYLSLKMQKRYDDALLLTPEFKKAIHWFEEKSGAPQPTAWGNFYIAHMSIYLEKEDFDKAEAYCDTLGKMINIQISQYELLQARALILASRGQYAEAMQKADSAIYIIGEQDKQMLVYAMETKLVILMQSGQTREAYQVYGKIVETQDAINSVEVNARFDELRTQYEVDKHVAEKKQIRVYLVIAFACCLLLIAGIAAILFFYLNRNILIVISMPTEC